MNTQMQFLLANPFLFYGGACAVALALAVASRRENLIKIALVLLFDWAAYNIMVNINGFERAPLLIPTFDAIMGIWVGMIAWSNRCWIGASVFGLFALVVAWWALELWTHAQATYLCYLVANLIFLLQIAIVGGAGGWAYVADRSARSDLRPRPRLAGG